MLLPAVHAQDAGASGAGPEKPEQRQDQRGLARPVGPEQPHRLSRARNAETAGDPVEDLPPSQLHLQVLEFDDRCRIQVLGSGQCRGTTPDCCPTLARPRLWSSITSMINPEIRVRLAAWICSGVPSNTTRIGSRPATSSRERRVRGQRRQDSECPLRVQPGEGGRVESGRRGELAEELRRPDERGAAVPGRDGTLRDARSEAATM